MDLVRKNYAAWGKSDYILQTPLEPPQTQAKRAHLDWTSKTLARLAIGFHGPAYSEEQIDKASLDLLAEAAFSPSSAIYQKLVIQEQKCQSLGAGFGDNATPTCSFSQPSSRMRPTWPTSRRILRLERLKTGSFRPTAGAQIEPEVSGQHPGDDGQRGQHAGYLHPTRPIQHAEQALRPLRKSRPKTSEMVEIYFLTNSTVVTLTAGSAK
jgi:hypothetical protein